MSTLLSAFYIRERQSGLAWLLNESACSICHSRIVGNTLSNFAVSFEICSTAVLSFLTFFRILVFSFTKFVSDSPYTVVWSYRPSVILDEICISDFHSLSLLDASFSASVALVIGFLTLPFWNWNVTVILEVSQVRENPHTYFLICHLEMVLLSKIQIPFLSVFSFIKAF